MYQLFLGLPLPASGSDEGLYTNSLGSEDLYGKYIIVRTATVPHHPATLECSYPVLRHTLNHKIVTDPGHIIRSFRSTASRNLKTYWAATNCTAADVGGVGN